MAVYYYDEALLNKIKRWTGDTNLHIYSPSDTKRLFEVISDETNDQPIQLPILCLRRNGGYTILNTNKRALTYDGSTLESVDGWVVYEGDKELTEVYMDVHDANAHLRELIAEGHTDAKVRRLKNGKSIQANAIPIQINYQLDIYTRYLQEADDYMRNLIFNIINYPTVQISIPYSNSNFTHNSTLRVSAEVEDNSDIAERLIPGQFTRLTLQLNLDDAYLWDIRDRDNRYIAKSAVDED